MATTYEAIATVEVGSGGAASIEFTSIPNTFTDLLLKASLRSTNNAGDYDPVKININSSSSDFSGKILYGTGSSAGSETPSGADATVSTYTSNANNTASTFGNIEIYIPNYTSTSNGKSISIDGVSENNATAALASLSAKLWNPATQAAITSIKLLPYSGVKLFTQYSTATLYGIKNS
jgi:hypothetical protein